MIKNKKYYLTILLICALFFMMAFVTNLQNPFGVIIGSYSSSNFLSQLGNFSNFIAYAFMGIPAGILLSRLGYRKMIILSLCVGLIGLFIMSVGFYLSYFQPYYCFLIYLLGSFITGFCMCMFNTIANPLANNLGGGGNKGNQLIQCGAFSNSLAATIVPVLCGYALGSVLNVGLLPLIYILILVSIIFILMLIVVYFMNLDEYDNEVDYNQDLNRFDVLKYPHFVFGCIAIFCYLGIEVGIPNMCNLMLVNKIHLEPVIAGSVVSTFWLFMMIGRFGGFFLASKISSSKMLKYASIIVICLLLLSIFVPPNIFSYCIVFNSNFSLDIIFIPIEMIFLVFCGLFASIMWGAIFNLAVEGLGKYTEGASGIFMTMVCGGGIFPLIQGSLVDITGYFNISFLLLVVLLIYILWYSVKGYKYSKNI